jgi:hypothetical protein
MSTSTDENSGPDYLPWYERLARYPLAAGLVIGVLAALVQGLLISAGGPEAYGFCVACHTRDLVNDAINGMFGTKLAIAAISANAILPVLTVIGVLIGAFAAAKMYGEFTVKKGDLPSYAWYVAGGIFFIIFALLMGGCPYRIALRIGYGDVVAITGLLGIICGIFAGTKVALKLTERED